MVKTNWVWTTRLLAVKCNAYAGFASSPFNRATADGVNLKSQRPFAACRRIGHMI